MEKFFDAEKGGFDKKNIFGFPCTKKNAKLILLTVPWEATVSYNTGTSKCFSSILQASHQVDVFDKEFPKGLKAGVKWCSPNSSLQNTSKKTQKLVQQYLSKNKEKNNPQLLKTINQQCEKMNNWVYQKSKRYLKQGKYIGLIGGDHSTPMGYIKALSEIHSSFAILHFDAHLDLRYHYQGFKNSHASIIKNLLEQSPSVSKIISVGIRDYSYEEYSFILKNKDKIKVFFDSDIKTELHNSNTWKKMVSTMIKSLENKKVYITFDIDSLNPHLCPNTGTPVPGGLSFNEVREILLALKIEKKNIIGFDLVETGYSKTSNWDSNVSARILFTLCNLILSEPFL